MANLIRRKQRQEGAIVSSTATELNILDGVTSTTAEINILDGVTATAAEINLIDGGTARGTTAIASGDGVLINDGGTMRMTNVDTLDTYLSATTKTLTNKTLTTPALGTPASGVMTNMTGAVTASIVDDAITLAKMAGGTDGNIISYDSSGNPVAIATGSDGQVLTSAGAGAQPAFETAAGGGKILQVKSVSASDQYSGSSNSFGTTIMTNPALVITLADSSNKLLLFVSIHRAVASNVHLYVDLKRAIDGGSTTNNLSGETNGFGHLGGALYNTNWSDPYDFHYLDSPGTDSELTYQITFRQNDNITGVSCGDTDGLTTITGMEIDA